MKGPIGKDMARKMGAGITMVVVVILFALAGRWLDGKTGTAPLFLLLGALLGAVGGFLHLVSALAPEMLPWSRSAAARRQKPPSSPKP